MKKVILSILTFMTLSSVLAQAPEMFNYQSAVRNSSGDIVANQNVSFRISILEGSVGGNSVYVETHSATTSDLGLVDFKIGDGISQSGNFSTIDWGSNAHFVQVELDVNGGSNYSVMGTSSLVSVPYALHAKTSEDTPTNVSDLNNDAGFITSPNDGDFDSSNEIQSLSLVGSDLTISGGNTITLPVSGGNESWIMNSDSAVYLGQTNTISANNDFSVVAGENNTLDANYSIVSGMQNDVTGFMNMAVGFGDTIGQSGFTLYKYAFGENVKLLRSGNGTYNSIPSLGVGENIITLPGGYMFGQDITNSVGIYNYGFGRNIEFNTANAYVIGIGDSPSNPVVANGNRSFNIAFCPQTGAANNDIAFYVGANSSTNTGFVGIGTESPGSKLTVENGDIYLPDATNGVILTNPNGNCYRVTVDNSGSLITNSITCP
ncbi:hypothetical protein [Parvicella tangerina]|uniref:Uncharacterized protein n=1 Tax=Parvicella tangerina TaxID=2829795 RepID=A0A916JK52_9FLAO|nr:hypothetical protein [Parvicella tangerina]CAG5077061.1 hypothetical protein CRYO30217_00280 [Parvicella tangerina]